MYIAGSSVCRFVSGTMYPIRMFPDADVACQSLECDMFIPGYVYCQQGDRSQDAVQPALL